MTGKIAQLKKRPVFAAIGLISFFLLAIPIPYVAIHISTVPEYKLTLVFLVLGLMADVARMLLGDRFDFLILISVLLKALAFAFFALGGVLSVADYVAKIHLFGDSSQFPAIMAYGIMLLCSSVANVAQCFIQ